MGNEKYLHIRAYLLHEHWAIFHVLELYSTNQILSCHIGLCSIPPHFLVINLHFISILTALSNPTEKIHMELNATDIEFSTQFSRADIQFIFTYSRSQ